MKIRCNNPDHKEPVDFEMNLPVNGKPVPDDRDITPTFLHEYYVCPDCGKSTFLELNE